MVLFFLSIFVLSLSLSPPPQFWIIIHSLPYQLLSKVVHFKDNPSNPRFSIPFLRESPELLLLPRLPLLFSLAFRRRAVPVPFSELLTSCALAFVNFFSAPFLPGKIPLSLISPEVTVVRFYQQCFVAFLFSFTIKFRSFELFSLFSGWVQLNSWSNCLFRSSLSQSFEA